MAQAPISINAPTCPDCKTTMWMHHMTTDPGHVNRHHVVFICGCGRSSDQMIAEPEPTRVERCLQKSNEAMALSVEHLEQMRDNRTRYVTEMDKLRANIDASYRMVLGDKWGA